MVAGAIVILLVLAAGAFLDGGGTAEAERLAELLRLRDGMTVAEIGAGTGWLSVQTAARVGPSGHVYATELNPARLDQIRASVAEAGLTNVTVLDAGESSSNLPPGCCDAVYMRRVYHHLSDPAAITGDLGLALRPGGRLVIIEFGASGLFGRLTGMGIDQEELVRQVTAAGFTRVTTDDWPGSGHYVAVFETPTT